MRFDRAYVQVPVCGASRASLMTGIFPTWDRFILFNTRVDEDAEGAMTMPRFFKENGYYTVSLGKVFHHRDDMEEESWSEPAWHPPVSGRDFPDPESANYISERGRGPIYEHPDVPDSDYYDGKLAINTNEKLRELREKDQPFFMVSGFILPHMPWYAPEKILGSV